MSSHPDKAKSRHLFLVKSAILGSIAAVVAFVPGETVLAQTEDGVLEEIIVTSRRYEESLQDAPVAVGVMTADYMFNNRIARADDLMEVTPGGTWESFSKMQPVAYLIYFFIGVHSSLLAAPQSPNQKSRSPYSQSIALIKKLT